MTLRCDHCGEPFRPDERIFVIQGDYGRWTSLAREPHPWATEVFHRQCFAVVQNFGMLHRLRQSAASA